MLEAQAITYNMVRNTHGGSKTKSQARKSSGSSVSSFSVRKPRGEFEKIGVVSKMLGNGMCYVSIPSMRESDMMCMIRGKFRGRNKKHNFLGIGTEVIVGLREWEAPAFKTVDLLEVLGISSVSLDTVDTTSSEIEFTEDVEMDPIPAQKLPPVMDDFIQDEDIDFDDI